MGVFDTNGGDVIVKTIRLHYVHLKVMTICTSESKEISTLQGTNSKGSLLSDVQIIITASKGVD